MPLQKRHETREQKRYTRRATKNRTAHSPVHLWHILTVALCGVAGLILALALGGFLKARSDAYREEQSRDDWMLDTGIATPIPVEVPDIRAVAIRPEGNVGVILIAGKHGGVLLSLCDGRGTPQYASAVGTAAGLPVPADAPSLSEDIARVSRRGLNVTCVYTLTCFDAPDAASATYRRGLDLALLRECAEARPNDILLIGLPSGSDAADRRAMDFLQELNDLLTDLPARPAIGVALPPSAFANASSEEEEDTRSLYAGTLSPARLRTACDYLVMDLRSLTAAEVGDLLPHIRYAYVRHSLRLMLNPADEEGVREVLSHGFERLFEMEAPAKAEEPEKTNE